MIHSNGNTIVVVSCNYSSVQVVYTCRAVYTMSRGAVTHTTV